jgi:hypothetical protein
MVLTGSYCGASRNLGIDCDRNEEAPKRFAGKLWQLQDLDTPRSLHNVVYDLFTVSKLWVYLPRLCSWHHLVFPKQRKRYVKEQ